ncbi:unnamed protein product [Camellia sinensis]
MHAVKGARASWAWSSLLLGREVLANGLRWQVFNGSLIKFWDDQWVPGLKDFRVQSRRPSGCGVSLVQDVIEPRTKSWVKPKLEALVSPEEVAAIVAIPISIENIPDSFIWHHEAKGSYTVKSGYIAMVNKGASSSHSKPSSSFCWSDKEWKFIWGLTLPPKIKHFAWRMCNNFVASRQNLHIRR